MRRPAAIPPRAARRRAFSLIEVLVVVAILGLLTALLLPALASAQQQARRIACQSHLHQLGIATGLYLDEFNGGFWRYYVDRPEGRVWWFGFEPGGPGQGRYRALDKSRAVLGPYLSTHSDAFQCPDFPYEDPGYFPKFARRSASYGFNLTLGSSNTGLPTAHREAYAGGESGLFVFADGIHFDFNPGFNEGHYIQYMPNTAIRSGYAHFRHEGQAQLVFLDGHVDAQSAGGRPHATVSGGAAANLAAPDGSAEIYGLRSTP